ncbi:MAG TPA: DUF333 domain-containing protein [Anaerolineae bacterium]|nr:DUF333 domain-containing protein [Anaerolineae bacterium]
MKQRVAVVGMVLLMALAISACGSKQSESADPGMPNPASVYCEEHGGKVDIRTAEDGSQTGICVFEDHSECEEWAFYHGECQPGEQAEPGSGIANPASVYCEEHGGKVDIRTAEDGSQTGICVFEDHSECEEWAFYRGECQPGEQAEPGSGIVNPALKCEW